MSEKGRRVAAYEFGRCEDKFNNTHLLFSELLKVKRFKKGGDDQDTKVVK